MSIEDELKGRFRNEYHKGLINLHFTSKLLIYSFEKTLKQHKITEPQYNILKVLRGNISEGPLSIGFLKERMLDKNSDVSRIIDKLLTKNLIKRAENPIDRRQKNIEISESGLSLLGNMDSCELKVDALLSKLNETEIKELNRLLDKIRE
ncbi:MAG: MarR family transcriptional regulator [Bacteroidetes bacterium CG2_30_33_31]|nr:MAG: MarR family transcriptional regulator [Bacteroidetes bacterium CG2_30_33_31]